MTSKGIGKSRGAATANGKEAHRGAAVEQRPRESAPARQSAVHINWPTANAADSIAARYGMDEQSLAIRRQFIRLDDEDQALLGELASWAQSVAADVAREFYDWQFDFPPTRQFFDSIAAA